MNSYAGGYIEVICVWNLLDWKGKNLALCRITDHTFVIIEASYLKDANWILAQYLQRALGKSQSSIPFNTDVDHYSSYFVM